MHFVGREKELTKLNEYLQKGYFTSIVGIGGVGKTELATQYAHRYDQEYDGILWFNSRDRDLEVEILRFFQLEFDYEIPQELGGKQLTKKEQVAWCWRKYPESNLPILVIFDDVIDAKQLREVLPRNKRFRVLITTRLKRLGGSLIKDLQLDVLSPEHEPEKALELLHLLLGELDRRISREPEAAAELCKCLEYLPLGIELVGGYLVLDPDLPLAVMERNLKAEKLANPALESPDNSSQLGVRAAFALTWVKLAPNAKQLGKLLSLFASKQITWDLVIRVATESETEEGEKQLTWSEKEINDAKKQLYQRNIIQCLEGKEKSFYQVHSLLRWFLQERLLESTEIHLVLVTIFIKVIVVIAKRIPEKPTSEDIKGIRYNIIHLEELAKSLYKEIQRDIHNIYQDSIVDDQVMFIFRGIGRFYEAQTLYTMAESWYKKCLKVVDFFFSEDHPDVAHSLAYLAALYQKQGRYAEAEPLHLQALDMLRRLHEEDSPDVALSLNNLAVLYQNQGRYQEAESFYLQSLEIYQQHPNLQDYLHVAKNLSNLAVFYQDQGRYAEAEPLHMQALEMFKRIYKGDNPDVAFSLNNLAALYQNQGRYQEAESFYLQSLDMRKHLYEGEHPDVALSLNNLAALYQSQGRYQEAESFYLQSLEMYELLHEDDHPLISLNLNNLAVLYQNQRRYGEAEPLCLKALEMRKRCYERDHPDVANSLNNLALVYKKQGKYDEAETLYLQTLEMRKRCYERDHPDVANSLNNLGVLYVDQEKYLEAETLYQKSLEMYRRLYEGDHPRIALSLNNLGGLYYQQKRYSEAEFFFQQALEIYQRILGPAHPNTITVQGHLNSLRQRDTHLVFWKRILALFFLGIVNFLILPFYLLWLLVKKLCNVVFP